MSEGCPDPDRFDRLLRGEHDGPRERRHWEQHLGQCEACRELVELDQDLRRSFSEVPIPELSAGLEARLQKRLAAQRRGARVSRLKRAILQGYWVAALFASYAILQQLGGFSGLFPQATAAVASAALLLLGTAAFLARRFRMDLTDLVWHTALAPRV
jgi:anti-sigma factor RsiW